MRYDAPMDSGTPLRNVRRAARLMAREIAVEGLSCNPPGQVTPSTKRLRTRLAVAAWLLFSALTGTAGAAEPPSLAKARALYNDGNYEGAIDAAAVARRQAVSADAAALVIGRSHLELYRQRLDAKELEAAREALTSVRLTSLMSRDRAEVFIGMGLLLYHGEKFGAAADLFDTALMQASLLSAKDRSLLLDWWATALDREAQTRQGQADRRRALFERIAARMNDELRQDPGSNVANYWRAVAARGAGDLEAAWDAAVAAWVVSTLSPETTDSLRADLERLVQQALIPERSRLMARDPQEAVASLRAEWELVKQQYSTRPESR